jgi:methionyl-tRNA synthetase
MAARYFNGEVTATPSGGADEDRALCEAFGAIPSRAGELVDQLAFNRALETIWMALDAANKYIVATSPFTLAKDPANLPRVAQILANLLEGLRVAADTLEPFMPVTSRKILDLLAVDETAARAPFGQGIKQGHRVKPPVALFPRIEKADKPAPA